MNHIEDFWMDYSASYYNRLKKADHSPGIDIYFNTSTTMSLNVLVPVIVVSHYISFDAVRMKYILIPMALVFFFNWLWIKRNLKKIDALNSRRPKYKWFYYRLYSLLFLATIYFTSSHY